MLETPNLAYTLEWSIQAFLKKKMLNLYLHLMVWLEIGHIHTVEPYLHWGWLITNSLEFVKFDLETNWYFEFYLNLTFSTKSRRKKIRGENYGWMQFSGREYSSPTLTFPIKLWSLELFPHERCQNAAQCPVFGNWSWRLDIRK